MSDMTTKWMWKMEYCKRIGLPPAQQWAWERAEEAFVAHNGALSPDGEISPAAQEGIAFEQRQRAFWRTVGGDFSCIRLRHVCVAEGGRDNLEYQTQVAWWNSRTAPEIPF